MWQFGVDIRKTILSWLAPVKKYRTVICSMSAQPLCHNVFFKWGQQTRLKGFILTRPLRFITYHTPPHRPPPPAGGALAFLIKFDTATARRCGVDILTDRYSDGLQNAGVSVSRAMVEEMEISCRVPIFCCSHFFANIAKTSAAICGQSLGGFSKLNETVLMAGVKYAYGYLADDDAPNVAPGLVAPTAADPPQEPQRKRGITSATYFTRLVTCIG